MFSMANIIPAILGRMQGYQVILHAHNNGLQSKSKLYTLIHLIGRGITKHMNLIRFTNSKLSSDFMFGKNVKSELIYNAIDTNKFSFNEESRKSIREELFSFNNTVIGFVGRLSRQKNPIFMLQVYAEYKKLNPLSELWIVGEGELKEHMNQEINKLGILDSVKWLGRRNDIEKLMCGMDLLLQPSLFEGLGIVLIEAQACGLLCVSSKDLIPDEAVATNLITLIGINNPLGIWAKTIYDLVEQNSTTRLRMKKVIMSNSYCINKEAIRLESIIGNI